MNKTTDTRLEDAIGYFLTALEAKGRSPRTLRWYSNYLKRWREFEPAGKVELLSEVTPELMDAWAVSLHRPRVFYEGHDYREDEEGTYSKHTIAGLIRASKTFFKFCHERGYIAKDPAKHLKQPNLSHQGRNKAMDVDDFKAMYDAAKWEARERDNPRDLAIFSFIADTAARRSEAANLRLDDLNLEKCVAFVEGKTGRRPVEFTEQTAQYLKAWLGRRKAIKGIEKHRYVFVGVHRYRRDVLGRPLTSSAISQVFRRLAVRAGVDGAHYPHSLRHLVGKSWVDAGVNLELVRLKLGHADIGVTARFYANQDRARVQAMTELHSLIGEGGD